MFDKVNLFIFLLLLVYPENMLSCSSLARSADVRYLINLCRSSAVSSEQLSAFKPKTALILAKLSKYDCEKSMETYLNDDQLKTSVC